MKQSRHSARIRDVFGHDEVRYAHEYVAGSRSFSVACTQMGRDRQMLEGCS